MTSVGLTHPTEKRGNCHITNASIGRSVEVLLPQDLLSRGKIRINIIHHVQELLHQNFN